MLYRCHSAPPSLHDVPTRHCQLTPQVHEGLSRRIIIRGYLRHLRLTPSPSVTSSVLSVPSVVKSLRFRCKSRHRNYDDPRIRVPRGTSITSTSGKGIPSHVQTHEKQAASRSGSEQPSVDVGAD